MRVVATWGAALAMATIVVVHTDAAFVLLNPSDYKDGFVERGYPCPQACGVVNESTFEWVRGHRPLFFFFYYYYYFFLVFLLGHGLCVMYCDTYLAAGNSVNSLLPHTI